MRAKCEQIRVHIVSGATFDNTGRRALFCDPTLLGRRVPPSLFRTRQNRSRHVCPFVCEPIGQPSHARSSPWKARLTGRLLRSKR